MNAKRWTGWIIGLRQRVIVLVITVLIVAAFGRTAFHTSGQIREKEPRQPGREKMSLLLEPTALSVSNLTTQTPTQLVQRIIGNNTPFSNVTYTGATGASGSFSGGTGIIGFEDGILLTTGSVQNVPGPNDSNSTSTSNLLPGDAALDLIIPNTQDAAVLEFDFVPPANTVTFQYVFGSEEYNEFVNATVNDVFALFVNGTNRALLPSTNIPIAINNVNGGNPLGTNASNSQFYRNNALPNATLDTELDGLTVVLSVQATVIPNQTNHIKLAIADFADWIYDSAVFIKAYSFNVPPPGGQLQLNASNYNINEGNTGTTTQTVRVDRIGGTTGTVGVNYATSAGSATGGASCTGTADYVNTSGTLSFAANETFKTFDVTICGDTAIEPSETIGVSLSNLTGGATQGTPFSGTITIVNDDNSTNVSFSLVPSSVVENSGNSLVYTFLRTGSTAAPLTVNFSIDASSTASVSDYTRNPTGTTVTIPVNMTSAALTVTPVGDSVVEPDETVIVRLLTGAGYATSGPVTLTGTIQDDDGCPARPISFGSSIFAVLDASSCLLDGNRTDAYSFNGTAGQQVALTMTSGDFFTRLALVSPSGAVMFAGGSATERNSRLPASDYFTLLENGQYQIRAIVFSGVGGAYSIALFANQTTPCTYSVGPTQTNVPVTGEHVFLCPISQPNCAPLGTPTVSGSFFNIVSYINGRVTFTATQNSTAASRTGTITFANPLQPVQDLTHTISQFSSGPATNNPFATPVILTGINSPTNAPIIGHNTSATAENGEPFHAGLPAMKSVWYRYTPATGASGLYSFSTAGSSFDTVMAIYACPTSGACTFANITPVGSNDDTTFFDTTSKVNFRADGGRTYMIAVDGKNGDSGTISLSWRQYQRLYRLYLQNYNGSQSPLIPFSLQASNGSNTVNPLQVAQGIYEFNLPSDGTIYSVSIGGPEGISWNPGFFPLDTSFRLLDELMRDPDGATGGQNTVSNSQNQTPRFIYGYIKNITAQELTGLSVVVGSSRGPNSRDAVPCTPLLTQTISSVPYATYQCPSQPQTLHDIIPNRFGKNFTIAVRSFENPVNNDEFGLPTAGFIAASGPT